MRTIIIIISVVIIILISAVSELSGSCCGRIRRDTSFYLCVGVGGHRNFQAEVMLETVFNTELGRAGWLREAEGPACSRPRDESRAGRRGGWKNGQDPDASVKSDELGHGGWEEEGRRALNSCCCLILSGWNRYFFFFLCHYRSIVHE